MIASVLGTGALLAWIFLIGTGFWRCRERADTAACRAPESWPKVVVVIPARNEADVIERSLRGVLAQDYPGTFRVFLVDDNSTDGTGDIARRLADPRLNVVNGAPLAPGWTGKLWAVSQGVALAQDGEWLWLTDADIEHAPQALRRLVGIGHAGGRKLVSFMARLHCETWPERVLVPAFVYFFMMLYPFNWINRRGPIAGAAGGCILVRRDALEAAGGIAAIRGALIDDCTLGKAIKRQGPIWLGLTDLSFSIRPYRGVEEILAMISRSAYAQLRYSPILLVGTILGLALIFAAPPVLALFAGGGPRWMGLAAWVLMACSYLPMLMFYRRSPLWGIALPFIAAVYSWCTVLSAWQYYLGRGGMWKGRVQARIGE